MLFRSNKDDILFRTAGVAQHGYFANFPRTVHQGGDFTASLRAGQVELNIAYSFLDAAYGADGSLFTDGMLWHGENSILAINTAALLSRGQRSRFAVLEYGGIPQPAINPPPQMSPPPRPFNPPPFNPPPPNRLPRSRSQSQRSQAPPPPPPPRDLDTTLQTLNALLDKVQIGRAHV